MLLSYHCIGTYFLFLITASLGILKFREVGQSVATYHRLLFIPIYQVRLKYLKYNTTIPYYTSFLTDKYILSIQALTIQFSGFFSILIFNEFSSHYNDSSVADRSGNRYIYMSGCLLTAFGVFMLVNQFDSDVDSITGRSYVYICFCVCIHILHYVSNHAQKICYLAMSLKNNFIYLYTYIN